LTTTATPLLQAHEVKAPSSRYSRSLVAVVLLFLFVYAGSLFSPPLLDDADSTHAEAAREMYVSGDWVTLHINGVRYLEKAPMLYWLDAISYHAFGVNEFSTRLPDTLATLALALLAWRWGRRAFGERAGIYAALFVVTTAGVYLFSRMQIPEPLLALFISLSLYLFLTALEGGKRWRWYGGYTCVALAVLTKGLLALVVVGFTAIFFIALSGEWRCWREFRLGTGLLLFFAIAAPWHILAGVRNEHFFWFYFINEHVLRFLGRRYPKDYSKLPPVLYWTLHLVWLFPWSAYLPVVVRDAKRHLSKRTPDARFAGYTRLMCWLWAGIVLVFFAFSTNQEYYTFPAYLPLLILIAASLAREEEAKPKSKWLIATTAAFASVAIAAGIALLTGLWTSRHIGYVPDIGTVLNHNLANDTLSMSHALDLTSSSLAALRLPAALAAIAMLVFPLLALGLRLRKKHFAATWSVALGMALFLFAAHLALERFGPYLSSEDLATVISEQAKPNDKVMIYGDQAFGSSLLFYLKRQILLVNGDSTSMWFGSTYPDAPHIFLDDNDLNQAWSSSQRVFLFVPPQLVKDVETVLPVNRNVIAESSGKVIYSNWP
jgi:4-amino-4-deoxy-L-arabinose transferase-like glycosyltransferase